MWACRLVLLATAGSALLPRAGWRRARSAAPLPRAGCQRARWAAPPPTVVCQAGQQEFVVKAGLDDDKVEKLFAWLSRAFAGDDRYDNLSLAFASIFGDHAADSPLARLVAESLAELAPEEQPVGAPYSLRERERGSLGAMGAAQWTGQFTTRPHALLDVRNLTHVDEWSATLPRGARRTLAKAAAQGLTVAARPIRGDEPAPHSTLAHLRCVTEHEVRIIADGADGFFEALQHAISRYQNCVSQAGEIREYRDEAGRVIAFAHESTKGRVMRGQWF